MRYEDPLIDDDEVGNVNVSSEHPLKTFFKLLTTLGVLCVVAYTALNLAIYQIVQYIPFSTEQKYFAPLTESMLTGFVDDSHQAQTQALQNIADKLRRNALAKDKNHPLKDIPIQVHYSDDEMVNAFALPAGHIVIMRGLIEKMPNENMLAMVIGHEMGHVVHRDHLKRLGRVVLTNLTVSMLLGDSGSGIAQSTVLLENNYSREDESKADALGLQLINTTYGHALGAAELFDVFATVNPSKSAWIEISSTHPLPVNRRQNMQALVAEKGYSVLPKKPLPLPVALQAATLAKLDDASSE